MMQLIPQLNIDLGIATCLYENPVGNFEISKGVTWTSNYYSITQQEFRSEGDFDSLKILSTLGLDYISLSNSAVPYCLKHYVDSGKILVFYDNEICTVPMCQEFINFFHSLVTYAKSR